MIFRGGQARHPVNGLTCAGARGCNSRTASTSEVRLSPNKYAHRLGQRRETQCHQRFGRTRAHQADAPDAAGRRSEPCANLDVESLEHLTPHRRLVDAVRHPNAFSVHNRSPGGWRNEVPEPRVRLRAADDAARGGPTAPANPLLRRQRFAERVDQRRAQRVVILAAKPVIFEEREVQRKAAARHASRARALPGRVRHQKARQRPSDCSCRPRPVASPRRPEASRPAGSPHRRSSTRPLRGPRRQSPSRGSTPRLMSRRGQR